MSNLKLMGLDPSSTTQCLLVLQSWLILLVTAFACHGKSQPAVTRGGTINSICNKMTIKRLWEVLLPSIVEALADVLMKVLIKVLLILIMFSGTWLLPSFQQGPEEEASKSCQGGDCPQSIATSSTQEVLLKTSLSFGRKTCVSRLEHIK